VGRTPNLTWGDLRRFFQDWSRRHCASDACWRIDGRPVCGLLNITDFVRQYGLTVFGVMLRFAARVVEDETGRPPYFMGVIGQADTTSMRIANQLPIDGVTGYALLPNWLSDPVQDYSSLIDERVADWYVLQRGLRVPFYPVVCTGWDATPRAAPKERLSPRDGYPYSPVVVDVTPELFGHFLDRALEFNRHFRPRHNLVFLHAWNEWSEASVLEPSDRFGFAFLDEVKRRSSVPEGPLGAVATAELERP
jgi:hypothetical protein